MVVKRGERLARVIEGRQVDAATDIACMVGESKSREVWEEALAKEGSKGRRCA